MRRGPYALALARSAVYAAAGTLLFVVCGVLAAPLLLLPPERSRFVLEVWTRADMLLARLVLGQRTVVLGRSNLPDGPALVAAKHQAAWETLALVPLVPRSAFVMKKELLAIPLFGSFARHYGMIPVDRAAGPSALKALAVAATAALAKGLRPVIFPEGTRQPLSAPPDYKPGALFLYERLKVPMVPVALNSGVLWPRGQFVKWPGTITVSFLPPIPPGLPRAEAKAALERAIETETARLVALDGRPPP